MMFNNKGLLQQVYLCFYRSLHVEFQLACVSFFPVCLYPWTPCTMQPRNTMGSVSDFSIFSWVYLGFFWKSILLSLLSSLTAGQVPCVWIIRPACACWTLVNRFVPILNRFLDLKSGPFQKNNYLGLSDLARCDFAGQCGKRDRDQLTTINSCTFGFRLVGKCICRYVERQHVLNSQFL